MDLTAYIAAKELMIGITPKRVKNCYNSQESYGLV